MLVKSTPDLIVSNDADKFLKKIWKDDGICYATLKQDRELKSVLMGKNMKRNKFENDGDEGEVSISLTFYEQLLHVQISKAQKKLTS